MIGIISRRYQSSLSIGGVRELCSNVEAVRLVRERSVSAAQAARDLGVHENALRKRVKEFAADPQHAFPGQSR